MNKESVDKIINKLEDGETVLISWDRANGDLSKKCIFKGYNLKKKDVPLFYIISSKSPLDISKIGYTNLISIKPFNKIGKELKRQIIKDWIVASKCIDKIVSEKRPNYWIKPNQYLSASFRTNVLSLDDKDGEFFHYNTICETLEKLLTGEKAEYTCQFKDAPEEIEGLLDKSILNKP